MVNNGLANARMVLLHKLSQFGASREDLKTIYVSYIRSVLEQSAVVWHTSLSEQNRQDLDRVQKSACKIILRNKYDSYKGALETLNLEDLHERRNFLCKSFAQKSEANGSLIFEPNDKLHTMDIRNTNQFKVTMCNTDRLLKSALPQMQRMMNQQ